MPGLGLKQGLEEDRVVAPYATAIAAMLAPREALENFYRLAREGAEGAFGFYEAIDFTPHRVPSGRRSVVVRTYMAHHQGMSLTALTNVLLDDVMPRRFHAEPMVRAVELLLEERPPHDPEILETAAGRPPVEQPGAAETQKDSAPMSRRLTTSVTPTPRTHLLSNTRYHVMITNAGAGSSAYGGLDVTRWREDPTCEPWGQFCYIRDKHRGLVWSAGFQPVCRPSESNEVSFAADKATFRRRDGDIETLLEVIVSPEQAVEVRRITLTNHGSQPRELEVTSYAEIVLTPHGADLAHPAFGKLFLETEWVEGPNALLCRRRPRAAEEQSIWAVHVSAVDVSAPGGTTVGGIQYETDRSRFLGRGRTPANPAALDPDSILSGTTGAVLDPVFSVRREVRLEPAGSAMIAATGGRCDAFRGTGWLRGCRYLSPPPARASNWPGPTTRSNIGTVNNRARTFISFSGWLHTCCSPDPRCAVTPARLPATAWALRHSCSWVSRLIGQSSWSGSPRTLNFPLPENCLPRRSTFV